MGSADIKFSFSTESFVGRRSDVLLVPAFASPKPKRRSKSGKATPEKKPTLHVTPHIKALDEAMGGALRKTAKEEGFTGAKGSLLTFRPDDGVTARRVVLVGLGDPGDITLDRLNKAYSKAFATYLKLNNLATIGVVTPELDGIKPAQWVHCIADVAHEATYCSEESLKPIPELGRVVLFTEKLPSVTLRKILKDAVVFAKAKSLAKDLVNKPANQKNPDTFVDVAKKLAKHPNVKVTVKDDVAWIEKNMPCFFEVARGSVPTAPPRFIHLHYTPGGSKGKKSKNLKKLALVGKTVVFDTGGYQVKTGNYMNTMKGDMTGGATVLAVMQAVSELGLNIDLSVYLAATPNMIDAGAMIPDSIVGTTCGKKVEIRHTDAEGRLTLIDAVAMAAKEEPEEIITIATLTGSAGVAVGHCTALMGNNNELRDKVEKAARYIGEAVQPLDVTEGDYDNIQSDLDGADIRNTQKGKGRGAQTAGAFVMSGAPDGMPMAHLDIAGGDFTTDEKATGIATRGMIQFVMDVAG